MSKLENKEKLQKDLQTDDYTKQEQEVMEWIQNQTAGDKVPEALSTQQMQEKIQKQKIIKRNRMVRSLSAMAAGVILIVGVGVYTWATGANHTITKDNTKVPRETKQEEIRETQERETQERETQEAETKQAPEKETKPKGQNGGDGNTNPTPEQPTEKQPKETVNTNEKPNDSGLIELSPADYPEERKKAPKYTYQQIARVMKKYNDDYEVDVLPWTKAEAEKNAAAWANAVDATIKNEASATPAANEGDAAGGENDYSTTNVRTENVDEADVIKTNGTYLFALTSSQEETKKDDVYAEGSRTPWWSATKNMLSVISLKDMKQTDTVCIDSLAEDEGCSIALEEIYATKDQVVAIASQTNQSYAFYKDDKIYLEMKERGLTLSEMYTERDEKDKVFIITYRITSSGKLKKQGCVTMQGRYEESRLKDGYIYCFTDTYMYNITDSHCTPKVNDKKIKSTDVYMDETETENYYLSIVGIDLKSPKTVKSKTGILIDKTMLYVSDSNIYITALNYTGDSYRAQTRVVKFSYDSGKVKYYTEKNLRGELVNSFAIDEKDTILRLVLEEYEWDDYDISRSSRILLLDKNMKKLSGIENLAEDESVKSVRCIGDMLYFVTFLNTDPLFAVDVSDVFHPVVKSELKITGFSSYMHPWNGKMLGLGMEVEEDGETFVGTKLSMFDISNSTKIKEEKRTVLKDTWASFSNYKAILVDAKKNLIGFEYENEKEDGGLYYEIYQYSEKNGFVKKISQKFNSNYYGSECRSFYSGKAIYIVYTIDSRCVVTKYDLNTFKRISKKTFQN